jgi:hypothetical protein
MALVLVLIYICGMLGMVVADRYRVGLTQRGRLSLATVLTSLPWALTTLGKIFAWPAVLALWLVQGRPRSPWQATTTRNGTLTVRRRTGDGSESA